MLDSKKKPKLFVLLSMVATHGPRSEARLFAKSSPPSADTRSASHNIKSPERIEIGNIFDAGFQLTEEQDEAAAKS